MLKKYQAMTDFDGIFRMEKGEIARMNSDSIHVKDLLKAKLIKEVKPAKPKRSKKK